MSVIYLTKPPSLECDVNGKIKFKALEDYFRVLGTWPTQIKLQLNYVAEACIPEVVKMIETIEKIITEITEFLMTPVFKRLKSWEQEMQYKVREFFKDIDTWIQKKLTEALLKLLSLINIPNPLTIPLPFIGPCDMMDEAGKPIKYQPVVGDLFTKEGKVKIKSCIAQDIQRIKDFFADKKEKFEGTFGIKSPEHEAEELWHKIINWINKTLEDFIGAAINALIKLLSKIPIIGPLIKKLLWIDLTKPLDQAFEEAWQKMKEKVKKAKEDLLSGKIFEDLATKIIDEFIEFVLNIPIPLFGTLGKLMAIDYDKEKKKYKIHMKENLLARIEDAWKNTMEKIKRFFSTDIVRKINDIIAKAPGWILKRFPIVNKIYKVIKTIIDLVTGKISTCQIMTFILKPIFDIYKLIEAVFPPCIQVKYTKYGLEPGPAPA